MKPYRFCQTIRGTFATNSTSVKLALRVSGHMELEVPNVNHVQPLRIIGNAPSDRFVVDKLMPPAIRPRVVTGVATSHTMMGVHPVYTDMQLATNNVSHLAIVPLDMAIARRTNVASVIRGNIHQAARYSVSVVRRVNIR